MLQNNWIKWFIGFMVGSALLVGCAGTGTTVSGTKQSAKYDERFDPAGGLDPNSPSFWLDYQSIYGPK
jgi:hypothetical protein